MKNQEEGENKVHAVRHVVLIDDEDDCNFVSTLVLKKAGFIGRITSITSGAEAMQWLRSLAVDELPDLVFVDINMPGMSGFDLLAACERDGIFPNGHSSVIVFSSSILPMDIERAHSFAFVSGYAEKALDADRFNDYCAEHIRRKAA
ncbi:MAG: response regulator [Flavobacteriales bacterium]|nr:response regulator [Flavobacteriales bacterium]